MPEDTSVLLELERLRRSVDVGFAELKGELSSAVDRTGKAEKDIEALQSRVSALEHRMWLFIGGGTALASGGAAGWVQLLGH